MCKICLLVLSGIPGAGKTTFVTKLQHVFANEYSFNVWNLDEIVMARNLTFREAKESTHNNISKLIEDLQNKHATVSTIIIIDDNMHLKSSRKKFYALAKQHEISYLEVYFKVDLHVALLRNSMRPHSIPDDVIISMNNELEAPKGDFLELDANKEYTEDTFAVFKHKLNHCLLNPLKNEEIIEVATLPISKIQEVELILRKIVTELIKLDKTKGAEYSTVKKVLFNNIKAEKIRLKENWNYDELYTFLNEQFHIKLKELGNVRYIFLNIATLKYA